MANVDDLKGPLVQQDGADAGRRRTWDLQHGPAVTDVPSTGKLELDFSAMPRTIQVASFTLSYQLLTAAALTQDFTLTTLPAGAMIMGVAGAMSAAFSIPSATFVYLNMGTAVDVDSVLRQTAIHVAPVDGQINLITYGASPNRYFGSATALTFQVQSDQNVNGATAGNVTLRVAYAVVG
jgi:hypothetical protein